MSAATGQVNNSGRIAANLYSVPLAVPPGPKKCGRVVPDLETAPWRSH